MVRCGTQIKMADMAKMDLVMSDADDDADIEALRLVALQSLAKPKFINKSNLISIVPLNTPVPLPDTTIKLEPISPTREQRFLDEKLSAASVVPHEDDEETDTEQEVTDDEAGGLFDDNDSLEQLLDKFEAEIEGKVGPSKPKKKIIVKRKRVLESKAEDDEVKLVDVLFGKKQLGPVIHVRESITPDRSSPNARVGLQAEASSRSPSLKRSLRNSWSRSPRPRRWTRSRSRSVSPRFSRRPWSRSPPYPRSPDKRVRSPVTRSPRRRSPYNRSPLRTVRRSRSPFSRSNTRPFGSRSPRPRSRTPPLRSPRLRRSPLIGRSPLRDKSPPRVMRSPLRARSRGRSPWMARSPLRRSPTRRSLSPTIRSKSPLRRRATPPSRIRSRSPLRQRNLKSPGRQPRTSMSPPRTKPSGKLPSDRRSPAGIRRSMSPVKLKRSITPNRRRSQSPAFRKRNGSPRRRSRSPGKRASPLSHARRRPLRVARRSGKRDRLGEKNADSKILQEEKPTQELDPVLEARRRKFASVLDTSPTKTISLKSLKSAETTEDFTLETRIEDNFLDDESENSDSQEGRFKGSTSDVQSAPISLRGLRKNEKTEPRSRLSADSGGDSRSRWRDRGSAKTDNPRDAFRVRDPPRSKLLLNEGKNRLMRDSMRGIGRESGTKEQPRRGEHQKKDAEGNLSKAEMAVNSESRVAPSPAVQIDREATTRDARETIRERQLLNTSLATPIEPIQLRVPINDDNAPGVPSIAAPTVALTRRGSNDFDQLASAFEQEMMAGTFLEHPPELKPESLNTAKPRIAVKKDLFASPLDASEQCSVPMGTTEVAGPVMHYVESSVEKEMKKVAKNEEDLRSVLAKKRKERMALPFAQKRIVQSALQGIKPVKEPLSKRPVLQKKKRNLKTLIISESVDISGADNYKTTRKPVRKVRCVGDVAFASSVASAVSTNEIINLALARKLKLKRNVTIATQND